MRTLLLASLALMGCASSEPSVIIGSTPAMVSLCVPNSEPRHISIDKAQAACQKYGKNAQLTAPSETSCGEAFLESQARSVYNFRCVD